MKKWANKILLSPYFLSLVIAVIIILFIPPVFDRFRLETTGSQAIMACKNPDSFLFFRDIDGDGKGEKIDTYYEGGKRTALQIFDHNGAILDQWNFKGKYLALRDRSVVFDDFDKDGLTDIVVFTTVDDSVFFSRIGKFDGSFRFKERLLSTISRSFSAEISYEVTPEGFYDLNGDSLDEMIVSVLGARSLQPRKIMAFNAASDSLFSSGSYGTVPSQLMFADPDDDGNPEITGGTSGSGNIPDSLGISYSDYSAWLMVFDKYLRLKFEPVAFPGFRNELQVLPFRMNEQKGFAALLNPVGPALEEPVLLFFNPWGKVIHEQKLEDHAKKSRFLIHNPFDASHSTLLIAGKDDLTLVSNDLKVIRKYSSKNEHVALPYITDLQDDIKPEMMFTDDDNRRLFIYHSIINNPLVYEIPSVLGRSYLSFGKSDEGKPVILLQGQGRYQLLTYSANPLFYFRWLIYLGIYFGILLFVLTIRRLQRIQLERSQAIRDQIRELQLKSIHNQLDPHFTFNVFNSIAHIIRTEEKDFAYRSFLRFTGIVRSTLISSDRIVRSLEEEIRFVENYLELEKLRYKERLNYEIVTDPALTLDIPVPKMILQIFVENAIKHGIRHKPEGGKVAINIKESGKKLVMTVQDDGIGREKAREFSGESTGMGLMIMDRYIELFNQLNRRKIGYTIEDIFDDAGKGAGTRVVIDLAI